MVVDSSALVAIVLDEPGAARLAEAMTDADDVRLSAGTYVESSIVLGHRHGEVGFRELERVLSRFGVRIEDVGARHARSVRDAFLRFGKGRHPAALNFGDCFSYALAKERDEPLLFVGDDFARTDVRAAV